MENIKKIIDLIDSAIKEDAEINIMWWEIISDWFDEKVDHYRWLINNSKDWLTDYQQKLSQEYNITWLKIKYTNASWYFIEVPKSQISKVGDSFVHKQTLVNASRYITSELKTFEEEILQAEWKKASREYDLFLEIRLKILESFNEIKEISDKTAFIDFSSSMWEVAYLNNYVKPEVDKKYDFNVL